MNPARWCCLSVLSVMALVSAPPAESRPIVYARSTTVMADYRADTMREAQISYAPEAWWSFGLGYMQLDPPDFPARHSVTFARINLLARRWNMESAQANIFGWGGLGNAYVGDIWVQPNQDGTIPGHNHGLPVNEGAEPYLWKARQASAYNAGAQIDWETTRYYAAFSTDFYDSALFWHRSDNLQLGIAPYEHTTNGLATWFIVSARLYSGDLHEGSEVALLARFFKKSVWVEAGATTNGRLQAMAMFSF